MTTFDYILALGLLGLTLWSMRAHELTDRRLRRPLIVAAILCAAFLPAVPLHGADAGLVAIGILLGIASGAVSAIQTRVERDDRTGRVVARASKLAVGVTTVAFGGRIAFAIAATNGLGPAIARFSNQIGVDSQAAWVAALILMAAADLVVRAAILWRRRSAVDIAPRRPRWA